MALGSNESMKGGEVRDADGRVVVVGIDGAAVAGGTVAVSSLPALVTSSVVIGRVRLDPQTANGLLLSRVISAATTNATVVKSSGGQIYGWHVYNSNAAVRFLKFYNKATAPTVGTDPAVITIALQPANVTSVEYTNGLAFATGIGLGLTVGLADSDTAAVAANEIVVNTFYK